MPRKLQPERRLRCTAQSGWSKYGLGKRGLGAHNPALRAFLGLNQLSSSSSRGPWDRRVAGMPMASFTALPCAGHRGLVGKPLLIRASSPLVLGKRGPS